MSVLIVADENTEVAFHYARRNVSISFGGNSVFVHLDYSGVTIEIQELESVISVENDSGDVIGKVKI